MKLLCRVMLCLVVGTAALQAAADSGKKVDFAKDIQPILLKSCIECHGPEKQKGKLRLDSKEETFKESYTVNPGKAEESELYARVILPADDDDVMPAKGDLLTKAQTDLIRDWINQGANWPDDLAIKTMSAPPKEKDPRQTIKPSPSEQKAVTQLRALGVLVRPVAMNVSWTQANLRGLDAQKIDQAIPLLSKVLTLEDLNLVGLPIKDANLKHLAGLVNLRRLHLEKTSITDAGLKHIKGLIHLRYLNLYKTATTDAGLKNLESIKSLKNLYLWQTQVTDEGVEHLKTVLPQTDINRGWNLKVAKAEEKKEVKGEEKSKPDQKKKE